DSHAAYFLQREGISRLDVLNYISHGVSKMDYDSDAVDPLEEPAADEAGRSKRSPLEQYTVNLAKRAAQGKIDPLIGRAHEIRRTVQVLCRRRKNNPIYVGEPGVGKTAIVEGLALRIHEGQVPDVLRNAQIL